MMNYRNLYDALLEAKAEAWAARLPEQLAKAFDPSAHGNLSYWQSQVGSVPASAASQNTLDTDAVRIAGRTICPGRKKNSLKPV